MKIELLCDCPLPRELSPNAKRGLHWGQKAKARRMAEWAAVSALLNMQELLPKLRADCPVHYHVTVGLMKGQQHSDDDNAKANGALKKIRDVFAATLTAGEDRHWHMDGLTQVRDPAGRGYLLFTLEVPDDGLNPTPVSD